MRCVCLTTRAFKTSRKAQTLPDPILKLMIQPWILMTPRNTIRLVSQAWIGLRIGRIRIGFPLKLMNKRRCLMTGVELMAQEAI